MKTLTNKSHVMPVLCDIKPVDESGAVDVSKISGLQTVVNLGRRVNINKNAPVLSVAKSAKSRAPKPKKSEESEVPIPEPRNPHEELEAFLNENINLETELISIGGEVAEYIQAKPRPKPLKRETWNMEPEEIIPVLTSETLLPQEASPEISTGSEISQALDYKFQDALARINQRIPAENGIFIGEPAEISGASFRRREPVPDKIDPLILRVLADSRPIQNSRKPDSWTSNLKNKAPAFLKSKKTWLFILGIGLWGVVFADHYSFSVKNQVTAEGNSAVRNIQNAGENIKNFNFTAASDNFTQAYQEFSKAGDNLNFMGANVGSFLADLPGAGKLKSAQNLVKAGKLMADAGKAMSEAMAAISKTNLILNPSAIAGSNVSIGKISESLNKALTLSQKNLTSAKALLADISEADIPPEKKAGFDEFNSKLPLFEKLIGDAVDYSKFLGDFIGTSGTKKYLLLFENPAELRPTGGFPGTYGVVTFRDGKLQDFFVDDVYNLDGQMKELIIPPLQLQHITPNWGMRDGNWFADFPTSARKIIQFYKKESGKDIDGVVTVSPQIIADILEVTGPVEMPEYGLTIDGKNFMTAIQNEVEYKANRAQPKKIVMDLAPKLLKKLYTASSDKWLEIFNKLVADMEQKDILMYFRDLNLESFSADKGLSGEVKNTDSDYLMVTFSNVKGSKTDSVINSSIKVNTSLNGNEARDEVTITRKHNGGSSKYGFYNKQSPTYIRVLVPDGSQLISIAGNSNPKYQPIIDYSQTKFKTDDDLAKFEGDSNYDKDTGVTIYKESGKTEFGFWLVLNPGETKSVDLVYSAPLKTKTTDGYSFYIQKQPGLDAGLEVNIDGQKAFSGKLDKDVSVKMSAQ